VINFHEWAEILPTEVNGFQVIKIKKGLFRNLEYIYGAVSFDETEEEIHLKFEYEIMNGHDIAPLHLEQFKVLLGDLLCSIIDAQMKNEEVVYYGGTDGAVNN
jgi:hypothetical protein